jgi:hypothetical protein
LKRPRIKCTDCGEFVVHYEKGVANVYYKAPRRPKDAPREDLMDSWLNSYQYFLFRRVLFGLEVYSREEIRSLSSQKKKRILAVQRRAGEAINLFKQRVLNEKSTSLLRRLFYFSSKTESKDSLTKAFISIKETDPDFRCDLPLEHLGIRRMDIARELVKNNCLPYNFWNLTIKDDPRMTRLMAKQEPLDQK